MVEVVSEIGRLIEEFADEQWPRPKPADIARRLAVTRQTVSKWYAGSIPRPEHLRALATLLGLPYSRLTDAILTEQGYYPKESERHDASPIGTRSIPPERMAGAEEMRRKGVSDAVIEAWLAGEPSSPDREGGAGHGAGDHGVREA